MDELDEHPNTETIISSINPSGTPRQSTGHLGTTVTPQTGQITNCALVCCGAQQESKPGERSERRNTQSDTAYKRSFPLSYFLWMGWFTSTANLSAVRLGRPHERRWGLQASYRPPWNPAHSSLPKGAPSCIWRLRYFDDAGNDLPMDDTWSCEIDNTVTCSVSTNDKCSYDWFPSLNNILIYE